VTALRPRLASGLLAAAWCAALAGVVASTAGPVAVRSLGVSISGGQRLLVAAALLAAVGVWCRGRLAGLLDELARSPAPYVGTLLLVLGATALTQVERGAVSVGGADSAGYLLQAERWLTGTVRTPLPLTIPGVTDPWVQSGFGVRPDPSGTATVPTYPPGLPWLEAAAVATGGRTLAIRGIPILSALVALGALWALVRRASGHAAAALSVLVLATMPPFLYQALQPMSDVPALACWLLALALPAGTSWRSVVASAVAVLVACLIRPNLAPLVLAVMWQAAMHGSRTLRLRRVATVAAGAILAVVAVALVQAALYGSPWQSGYGRASELFALAHIPANCRLYLAWLREALATPTLWLLALGSASLAFHAMRTPSLRPPLLMASLTIALYLVYAPFDSWSYLRFVLVPLALLPIGAAHLLRGLTASRAGLLTFPVVAALALLITTSEVSRAQELLAFRIRTREMRYESAGTFIRDTLPREAVIVAVQHSASAPFYSGRPVVRADLLPVEAWPGVVTWAAETRRPLVFVLDEHEPGVLRRRFAGAPLMAFDWPPRAEIGRPAATRIWVADDRAAFLAGHSIPSRRIVDTPR